ncbi:Ribosomal protein L20 [Trinorchestia longiramus]|nr:Ribosomal protein L20 [Trinorchestia longiramus]
MRLPMGPHRYWKRRRVLAVSSYFYGRKNNCYRLAVRWVNKTLNNQRDDRKVRWKEMNMLWNERLEASCEELGYEWPPMRVHLREAGVALNKNTLQNLAMYEPRTFRSLVSLAKSLNPDPGLNSMAGPPPSVITKGML